MTPRVSVLLPVHNGGAWLQTALDSLRAQEMADFELVTIDDGSTDGSGAVLQAAAAGDPRIRVLHNPRNLGLTATLNRGLAEARAPLVARQDADDWSHPRRLGVQAALLEARADVVLVGSQGRSVDAEGRHGALLEHGLEHDTLRWELLFDNAFFHTAALFRRDAVRDAGGYDEAFRYCQDYDLWSRLAQRGRVANVADTLVRIRAHAASMTQTMSETNRRECRLVIERNLRATLGQPLAAEVFPHVAALREGPRPEQVGAIVGAIERMRRAYAPLAPAVERSRDFAYTLARQHVSLALSTRPRRLGAMGTALLAAFRQGPAAAVLASHAWSRLRASP